MTIPFFFAHLKCEMTFLPLHNYFNLRFFCVFIFEYYELYDLKKETRLIYHIVCTVLTFIKVLVKNRSSKEQIAFELLL